MAENRAFTALFSGEHVLVATCASVTRGSVFWNPCGRRSTQSRAVRVVASLVSITFVS